MRQLRAYAWSGSSPPAPGVTSARVDLAGGTATVEFDADHTKLPDLLHAIEQLGYTVQQ